MITIIIIDNKQILNNNLYTQTHTDTDAHKPIDININ